MYKQLCRAAVGWGLSQELRTPKIIQRGEEETHRTKARIPSGNEHKTGASLIPEESPSTSLGPGFRVSRAGLAPGLISWF